MIGDGCCAFVSIALGSGKKEDAHRSVGNAVILPAFMGLDGLLWSFPAADLLTFLIALFFIRQVYVRDARVKFL